VRRACAWDVAVGRLEIVAKIPAGPTYGDLRFNPCGDDLRGDKRFDKIVAAAKAASHSSSPKKEDRSAAAAVVTPKAFASLPLWGAQAASRNELSFT
jgi:hypothetical protein